MCVLQIVEDKSIRSSRNVCFANCTLCVCYKVEKKLSQPHGGVQIEYVLLKDSSGKVLPLRNSAATINNYNGDHHLRAD